MLELYSFSDVNTKAYGAAVYTRIRSLNHGTVILVESKCRSIIQTIQIFLPRLEFLCTQLASRLTHEVKCVLDHKGSVSLHFLTDSEITLYWIRGYITKRKPSVSNRVKEMQCLKEQTNWNHCAGYDRPDDLITRSIGSKCLVESAKWWTCPHFLKAIDIPELDENLAAPEKDIF